jgi:ParB-like nuclease domain
MINQDLVALSIYKTKDYSKFSIDDAYNRDVNENIVKKIKASIKDCGDKGHVFPIVVDDKFRIIDGQHRFKARKELGLSIYYIQDIELDSQSLGIINDAVGKWKSTDFEKVVKEKEIVKAMRTFQKDLPKEVGMNIIGRWAGITNRKMINLPEVKTEEIKLLLNQIKPYLVFLLKALSYSNLTASAMSKKYSSNTLNVYLLGSICKKLANKRVLISTLPLNYTYEEFVEYLVKNKIA